MLSLAAQRLFARRPLFDQLLDEPQRVGVLDECAHLCAIKPRWHLRLDLQLELQLASRQRRELLNDRLDIW